MGARIDWQRLRPWLGVWHWPVLAMLFLAWWNPVWLPTAQPVQAFILVDDVATLKRPDLRPQWRRLAASLSTLPDGSRYSIYQVANASPVFAQPLIESASTSTLSLEKFVEAAGVSQLPEGRRSRLPELLAVSQLAGDTTIVLSASSSAVGELRNGQVLATLQERGHIGRFTVDLENSVAIPRLKVTALEVPRVGSPGSRVPWQLGLLSSVDQSASLTVSLDGKMLTTREIPLRANQEHFEHGWLDPTDTAAVGSSAVDFNIATPAGQLQLQRLLNVHGVRRALYIGQPKRQGQATPAATKFVRQLRRTGWQIKTATPNRVAALLNEQRFLSTVVLDNVAVDDMATAAWQQLLQRVRFEGTGLVVLGGTRAFGAGGYRHSLLEQALPVTAEPATPQLPSAVLFVVDQSGSMDVAVAGIRRIDYAQQAVVASAELLQASDATGVLGFAATTKEWLPMTGYADARARILDQWSPDVGGATNLAAAMQRSISVLSRSSMQRRLLVLVTDGFTQQTDLVEIQRALVRHDIDVIAMAIGDDANLESLRLLTRGAGSRLVEVAQTSELPRLMRNNLALHRLPLEQKTVAPVVTQQLPFMQTEVGEWPALTGFLSTRARSGSRVYLATDQGDPLLAAGRYGLGNVVVLPAGLGAFAQRWPLWERWPTLIDGLMSWAGNGLQTQLHLKIEQHHQRGQLLVNAVDDDGEWDPAARLSATLATPANALVTLSLRQTAAGTYHADLPLADVGRYGVTVTSATGAHRVLKFNYNATQQTMQNALPSAKPVEGSIANVGNGPIWPDNVQLVKQQVVRKIAQPTQSLWIFLGLGLFAIGLALEARLDWRALARKLGVALGRARSFLTLPITKDQPIRSTHRQPL